MDSIVAETRAGAVSSVAQLSDCLRDAIRSPTVAVAGASPEGHDAAPHGADLREGRWEPPATITADMVVEAQRWREQHRQRSGWVQSGVLKQWLAIVISGCARRAGDDIDDAARLSALMFAVEEHPAYCFTKTTLREAQRRFKFLPTPAELLEFADAVMAAENQTADRLWKIVEAGVRTGGVNDSDVVGRSMRLNRERQDRERRELAAIVEAKYGPLPSPSTAPQMLPGETRADFIDRLREWRKTPAPPPTAEQMRAAYAATGIKAEDVRTANETSENAMSGSEA